MIVTFSIRGGDRKAQGLYFMVKSESLFTCLAPKFETFTMHMEHPK